MLDGAPGTGTLWVGGSSVSCVRGEVHL
jgi:hypothetical protein